MYAGTTLTPLSGRVLGTHQKIDRLARGSLRRLLDDDGDFPTNKLILHFEGVNGPDAIKRKSPAQDEPWHFYSPFNDDDNRLVVTISNHYDALVAALRRSDRVRAAFEAAWLAHALVDGLTPPHHYPYEEQLAKLRGGEGIDTRDSLKDKLLMPGETRLQQMRNNWRMWGPQGLIATHGFFEWGVSTILVPVTRKKVALKPHDIAELKDHGVLELFRRKAKEVAALGLYESFRKRGWTPRLAGQIRRSLIPTMVHVVTLTWYAACVDAGLVESKKV